MKTKPFAHQLDALRKSNGRKYFAYLMEQGTGKTWCALADAERLYAANHIDAIFVIAPNGVHTNWVKREIPVHMDCPYIARAWRSGAGKREMAKIEQVLLPRKEGEPPPLRILAMNVDALITKSGIEFAERFLNATKSMMIIDESTRIKNSSAIRTKNIMKLRNYAVCWRILTGTPVTNAPVDLFSQFEFLKSGLLGTTSHRAFVAEYADLVSITESLHKQANLASAKQAVDVAENSTLGDSRSLDNLRFANERLAAARQAMTSEDYKAVGMTKNNPRIAYAQIIAKNPDGSPRWKNLDKLKALIEPHSFRVLKKDCLDLPDKIYQNVYFDLGAKQQAAYDFMKEEFRIQLTEDVVLSVSELATLVKLQQITSGYVNLPSGGGLHYVSDGNPRLDALLDAIEDHPGKIIVWARFNEELDAIAHTLKLVGRKVVEYRGNVNRADREIAVDSFQNGEADVFVGQPQSGGIGLTLTAGELVIYYSNDWNRETRAQSEDRSHRIGTKNNVVYIDLIANDTIDERIAAVLQRKAKLAYTILGDERP